MSEHSLPTARVAPKPRFSLVWLIPLIAALIGGWLLFKYYNERGTTITITFDQAAGIAASKTPVRYKDVEVGIVKELDISPSLNKVVATVEIYKSMANNLGTDSKFWVVRPRVSLRGVSGLQTLLTGVHIGMDPGERKDGKNSFDGLSEPPRVTTNERGTSLILSSDRLGSMDIGSPVYYHQIEVGEVTGYELNEQAHTVDIAIYVHAPYDKKIKTNTRFWNAGGIDFELSASGVSARMESVVSLLIGGIAFETPKDEIGYPITGKTVFPLYESYKLAQDDTLRNNKLFYTMYFEDSLHGLSTNSVIEYGGVHVGKVESILLETESDEKTVKTLVKASLRIDKFSDLKDPIEAEEMLQALVQKGLHAQLTADSIITGGQYISLVYPPKTQQQNIQLVSTSESNMSIFPTAIGKTTLLSFDATGITTTLDEAVRNISNIIKSDNVKQIIKGLADTSKSIGDITKDLKSKGVSGQLLKTLKSSQETIEQVKKTTQAIEQTSRTVNKSIQTTLSEDSALQYKLQHLMNDLGEAANSFSVLADTIQRKPNSVIFGK